MNTKTYRLQVQGGAVVDDGGKTRYPDYVIVKMDKANAWEIVNGLLAQLRSGYEDNLTMYFLGRLTEEQEE